MAARNLKVPKPQEPVTKAAETYDLIIVGAGMVGATLAALVGSKEECGHWRIALVDAGEPPCPHSGVDFDPRVVALTRQSQRLFTDLGLWPQIQPRACPYQQMRVWDGEGTAEISFNCHEFHEPNLGHIVENSAILCALLDYVEGCGNVEMLRAVTVEEIAPSFDGEGQNQCLQLSDGTLLQAPLVVAADGANSKIRQLRAMPTREWDYGHQAIVTTIRTEKPHQYTAWQRFMNSGPLAFLPLPAVEDDDRYCSIVWSVDADKAPKLLALEDAEFAFELGRAFEHKLGAIESVTKRYSFPLRQRHAVRYIEPGVVLIGDAAHTIHPLAGQGVNLGLLDAAALVQELCRAQQRAIPLNDFSILRRYQRRRVGHNLAVMALMETFKRLFASQNPQLHVARNWGMRHLQDLQPLKNRIAKQAMGL